MAETHRWAGDASEIGGWKPFRARRRDFRPKASGNDDPPFHGEFSPRQARFGRLHFGALSLARASSSLRPSQRRVVPLFCFQRRRRHRRRCRCCCSYASVPFPGRFETSAASDVLDEDRSRDRLIGFHVVPGALFHLSSLFVRLRD